MLQVLLYIAAWCVGLPLIVGAGMWLEEEYRNWPRKRAWPWSRKGNQKQ